MQLHWRNNIFIRAAKISGTSSVALARQCRRVQATFRPASEAAGAAFRCQGGTAVQGKQQLHLGRCAGQVAERAVAPQFWGCVRPGVNMRRTRLPIPY